MRRLLVLVEGQSEEAFVNRILAPHLLGHGVAVTPTILETRHLPGRPRDKGGITSWAKVKRDLQHLLRDSDAWTTTLFDFYGLPADFPGVAELAGLPLTEPRSRAASVEAAVAHDLNGPKRFVPFLAVHEFEAWVLAHPRAVADHFGNQALQTSLEAVLEEFESVEHINHGPATHPSRRLEAMISQYKKVSDGPIILEKVGLAYLRTQCTHLDEWVTRLESIA